MSCLHTLADDPQVKIWGKMYETEFEIDRSRLVGLFLPTLNSINLIESCYTSLIRSMPDGYPFGLTVVDGGSTDGTVEFFKGVVDLHTAGSIEGRDTTGLCKDTPDACIDILLGKWDCDTQRFEREDRYGYIGWLHTDMDFFQQGWLGELVEKYESIENIGILGPKTEQYDDPIYVGDFPGNVAPFIVSVKVLKESYKRYGYFIDPNLWFCVGHCDWDMHRRFMNEMGYKSLITSDVEVRHSMLGTRIGLHKVNSQRDVCQEENKAYYEKKWGTWKDSFSDMEFQRRARESREQDGR